MCYSCMNADLGGNDASPAQDLLWGHLKCRIVDYRRKLVKIFDGSLQIEFLGAAGRNGWSAVKVLFGKLVLWRVYEYNLKRIILCWKCGKSENNSKSMRKTAK